MEKKMAAGFPALGQRTLARIAALIRRADGEGVEFAMTFTPSGATIGEARGYGDSVEWPDVGADSRAYYHLHTHTRGGPYKDFSDADIRAFLRRHDCLGIFLGYSGRDGVHLDYIARNDVWQYGAWWSLVGRRKATLRSIIGRA